MNATHESSCYTRSYRLTATYASCTENFACRTNNHKEPVFCATREFWMLHAYVCVITVLRMLAGLMDSQTVFAGKYLATMFTYLLWHTLVVGIHVIGQPLSVFICFATYRAFFIFGNLASLDMCLINPVIAKFLIAP